LHWGCGVFIGYVHWIRVCYLFAFTYYGGHFNILFEIYMSARDNSLATSLATKAVHAGRAPAKPGQPLTQGPVFASTFHLSGEVDQGVHQYGRFHHPNWESLEQGLGELEQGKALIFPSGMAAAAAVMTALLTSGDTVLLQSDGYQPSRTYAYTYLKKFGGKVKDVPTL
jgi:cystathionine gamma-lyase